MNGKGHACFNGERFTRFNGQCFAAGDFRISGQGDVAAINRAVVPLENYAAPVGFVIFRYAAA